MWTKYKALWIAMFGAAAVAITSVLTDGIKTEEWIQVVIQTTTAATVWLAANTPGLRWAKALAAAMLSTANLALSFVTDGVDGSEWRNLIIALVTAIVIGIVRGPDAPGFAPPRKATGGSYGVRLP